MDRSTETVGRPAMSDDHRHVSESGSRPRWTLVLVILYAVAETAGGLMSGSLALIADAGHMVSDAAAIGLTLFAIRFARRARPKRNLQSS
jgi:cobalt-zinc-cadmium efflux system protein